MAAFVDTNILIYAFVGIARQEPAKVIEARRLLGSLMHRRHLALSAQVLSEFASNALRKAELPLAFARISGIVSRLSRHQVVPIDETLVQRALQRVQTSRLSYWDALIVEAALRSGATTLYTEDLHHGTRYGSLEVCNPFLS